MQRGISKLLLWKEVYGKFCAHAKYVESRVKNPIDLDYTGWIRNTTCLSDL